MKKSELAWNLADYRAAKIDPPARIISNPDLSEGEMMSADEVAEFIKDSIATIRILADKRSSRAEALIDAFETDLGYLVSVGSLDEDDYNELTIETNLRF